MSWPFLARPFSRAAFALSMPLAVVVIAKAVTFKSIHLLYSFWAQAGKSLLEHSITVISLSALLLATLHFPDVLKMFEGKYLLPSLAFSYS